MGRVFRGVYSFSLFVVGGVSEFVEVGEVFVEEVELVGLGEGLFAR